MPPNNSAARRAQRHADAVARQALVIDNPAATPYRCARTDTRPHGATRENVAELSAQGLTDEGIAHRLGIIVNAVQTARRRAA